MIVFNLICNDCSSEFEGWFDDTKQYDQQKRKKMIHCPNCASYSIKKTLNTPNLSSKSNSKKDT